MEFYFVVVSFYNIQINLFNLQLLFHISDGRRNFVLEAAGSILRSFRTRLTTRYLKDEKKEWKLDPPQEPPPLYSVPIDVWREFVKQ